MSFIWAWARRLKCRMVGHARDINCYERPGFWRCARCLSFYKVDGVIGLEHATVLRRLGWSDLEIERLSFERVSKKEVFRYLAEVRRACGTDGAQHTRVFEDGYIAGYYAAIRDGAK